MSLYKLSALAIEPANCVFVIPPAFTVTAPELTAKSSEQNDAIPLLEVDASSPAIVIKLPVIVVSIPSPPTKLTSSPKLISKVLDDSSPIVILEFVNATITCKLVIVELLPSRFATISPLVIVKLPVDAPVNEPVPTVNLSALSS